MEKLPMCIFGDGCLLRLTDQKHDERYKHTSSVIRGCPIKDCPLYHKAYNFIIGEQTRLTQEIKDAQRHSSLNYHPPIRSKGVIKTRPRASSHIYPPLKVSLIPPSVPKLDLDNLSPSPVVNHRHSQNLKKLEDKYTSPIRASSDPARETNPKTRIFISPKRAESKDYMIFKNKIYEEIFSLKSEFSGMRADLDIIKNILISKI